MTMLSGTHTYNGGLTIRPQNGAVTVTLDASANNPTVNAVGPVFFNIVSGIGKFNMGSGLWLSSNTWDMRGGTVTQATGGILRNFTGTGQQKVYSSKRDVFPN